MHLGRANSILVKNRYTKLAEIMFLVHKSSPLQVTSLKYVKWPKIDWDLVVGLGNLPLEKTEHVVQIIQEKNRHLRTAEKSCSSAPNNMESVGKHWSVNTNFTVEDEKKEIVDSRLRGWW